MEGQDRPTPSERVGTVKAIQASLLEVILQPYIKGIAEYGDTQLAVNQGIGDRLQGSTS